MAIFYIRKRTPAQTLNDLEAYIGGLGHEPIRLLAREVQSWGEFDYNEIIAAIEDGRLNDLLDWQQRYSSVVNNILAPLWTNALIAAAAKASRGKIILSDSEDWVRVWLQSHGAELVTNLSSESRLAIANILLKWQGELMKPAVMAQQIRPLIGLTQRQILANERYRQRVFESTGSAAAARKAALRYGAKQHRQRAETILHTEVAFAYNRGAHRGALLALGRCAMVWSTAGTHRVCGRCLELKDKVVGYTDEAGVTLPPLHPRCRCAIRYEEAGAKPDANPNKPAALPDKVTLNIDGIGEAHIPLAKLTKYALNPQKASDKALAF